MLWRAPGSASMRRLTVRVRGSFRFILRACLAATRPSRPWAVAELVDSGRVDGDPLVRGLNLVEMVDHRIIEMAARCSATYPVAMKCLLTDRGGSTAYLRFPAEHRQRVRHSHFIERTSGETRHSTKGIGRLPGENACLTLVRTVFDALPAAGAA